jgi:hypothetical protein
VTTGANEPDRGIGGIGRPAAARLAWSLWALAFALTTLSLVLLVLNLSHPGTHVFDWWLGNALVVIDATVGAIVASRRPENPVGWLLCLAGVTISTSSFASQYAIYALLARPGSLPAGEALAWIAAWQLPIMNGIPVLYLLLFPTGRLPSRRWRPVAWLTVAFVIVGVVLSALSPGAYLGSLGPIRNPLGIEGLTAIYKAVFFTMAPLLIGAAVLSVFVRLRRSVGIERQQLKWFAYAVAAFAVGIILVSVITVVDTPPWFERAGVAFFTLAGAAYPVAIGIAILRYRLYDIDRIINRTLVYGSLTAMLALVYLGGVVGLQATLRGLTGQESTLAIVASTLLIAALFSPLRRRVQGFVDQRFYRRKYDAAKTLEAFNARLRDETDLDALSGDLVWVASRTVQPDHVSLWLRPDTKHETKSAPLEQSGHGK